MFFRLTPHCRINYFKEDLVLLDLKKNRYIVFKKKLEEQLIKILKTNFSLTKINKEKSIHYIKMFQKNRILTVNYALSPEDIPQKNHLEGANIDWRIASDAFEHKISFSLFLYAFYTLIKVYICLNLFGFSYLIHLIKIARLGQHPKYDMLQLVHALNLACFYFPIRVKCLEWASSLTLMSIKEGLNCQLQIGVQTKPFAAHAWVIANDQVIYDNPALKENTSIILTEPKENSK